MKIRSFLYCLFLLATALPAGAQHSACFTSNKLRGCIPLTVNMINCSTSPNIFYKYFEGGPNEVLTSHTYNTPGTYMVVQTVENGVGGVDKDTLYIEVLAPRKPTFEVDLCQGGNVTLTITDNIDDNFNISLNGVVQPAPAAPFVPSNFIAGAGLQNMLINPVACGLAADTSFYPIVSLVQPDLTRITVNNQDASNGQITIEFNASIEQRYVIEQSVNGGTFAQAGTLDNISGLHTFTLNNLNTASNQYCYRIQSFDDCSNTMISPEICSIISTVTAANNQNDLSWTIHPGAVGNYAIVRNSSLLSGTSGTSYSDNAVNCGVNYCYSITAELTQTSASGSPLQSVSDELCLSAISTNIPPAVQNLHSTFEGNSVRLVWDPPAGSVNRYEVQRNVNAGSYQPYASYSSPAPHSYTDRGTSVPDNNYCYLINYLDQCGNTSAPAASTCPMVLSVFVDNSDNMTNHLSWTGYAGGGGTSGYIIHRLDGNDNVVSSFPAGLSLSYTDIVPGDAKIVRYRIEAIPNGPAGAPLYSNVVEIKYEGEIYLPNAFTPNNDGPNDVFMAKGKFIKDFRLTIFNRWGEVVFVIDRIDTGWNGDYQGLPANQGAYAYLLEATDLWGKTFTRRGSVTLLR